MWSRILPFGGGLQLYYRIFCFEGYTLALLIEEFWGSLQRRGRCAPGSLKNGKLDGTPLTETITLFPQYLAMFPTSSSLSPYQTSAVSGMCLWHTCPSGMSISDGDLKPWFQYSAENTFAISPSRRSCVVLILRR